MSAVLEALHLTRHDVARLGPFALLGALGAAGLAIGLSTSSTLFLVHVGASKLPYLYLAMPLVMAVYTPLSSHLLHRLGVGRYYASVLHTLAVCGALLALGLSNVFGAVGPAICFAASLYTGLWYIALYTLFWSFAGGYFDLREAKRWFPVLASSVALGSIAGGLLVSLLSPAGRVGELFAVWSLLALLSLLPLRRILHRQRRLSDEEDRADDGARRGLREVGQAILRVRYVPVLGLLLFLVMLLSSLCQFQYLTIFADGRDEAELASLLGRLYAGANLFNLIMGLFVFQRLVAVLGVARTALVLPMAYTMVFAALSVEPSFAFALLGFFVYEGLLVSVDLNNQNLLFNALPSENRQEIRLLLEGLSEPLATATAGLALLLALGDGSDGESLRLLARVGFAGSLVAVALALVLRLDYVRAVVANLKRHWLDFSKPVEAMADELVDEEVEALAIALDPHDPRGSRLAWQLLWPHHHRVATDRLLDWLRRIDEARAAQLTPQLGDALSSGDAEVVRQVLETLESRPGELPAAIVDELGRHRLLMPERALALAERATSPNQRATAAVGLLNAWTPSANRHGLELVESLYDGDADERRHALWALGRSGRKRYAPVLLPHLRDEDGVVRQAALEAVEALATPGSARLVPALLDALAASEDSEDRLRVLGALEKIQDAESLAPLLGQAGEFTPIEIRRGEQLARSMGLESVPRLIQALRDRGLPHAARSISARALGALAPAQLEALSPTLIETELARATTALERAAALDHHLDDDAPQAAGLVVLRRLYRDAPRAPLDFILELLSIGGRLPDFELLSSSLRSNNRRLRADAFETLEQGLDRRLFSRLMPLLDSASRRPDRAAAAARSIDDLVIDALDGRLDLEITVAVAIGRSSASPRLRAALAQRLRRPLPPAARRLIHERTAVLGPHDGAAPPAPCEEPLIEHLAAFADSSFFDRFELEALEPLAESARRGRADRGKTFAPKAGCFYLVTRGDVAIPGTGRCGAGDVFAAETLHGDQAPSVRSLGARWLELSATRLRADAARRPSLAMALLDLRLEDRRLDDRRRQADERTETAA